MAAVWLNRYRLTCPDTALAVEIRGFEPLEEVLRILGIPPGGADGCGGRADVLVRIPNPEACIDRRRKD